MDTAMLINQGFSKPCKAITCSSLQWKVTVLSATHIASCLARPRWLSEEAVVILTAMADFACSCLQMHFDDMQCMGEATLTIAVKAIRYKAPLHHTAPSNHS